MDPSQQDNFFGLHQNVGMGGGRLVNDQVGIHGNYGQLFKLNSLRCDLFAFASF